MRPLDQGDWDLVRGQHFCAGWIVDRFEQRASLAGRVVALGSRAREACLARARNPEAREPRSVFFTEDETFVPRNRCRPSETDTAMIPAITESDKCSVDARWLARNRCGALRQRLPTRTTQPGLDRDAVDFFATVGAATSFAALSVSGEAGLGIHSTREARFEQEDVLLYSFRGELRGFRVTPSIEVLGQRHGTAHAAIRGVENLGELRTGVTIGHRSFVSVEAVIGYEDFSPSRGLILYFGLRR